MSQQWRQHLRRHRPPDGHGVEAGLLVLVRPDTLKRDGRCRHGLRVRALQALLELRRAALKRPAEHCVVKDSSEATCTVRSTVRVCVTTKIGALCVCVWLQGKGALSRHGVLKKNTAPKRPAQCRAMCVCVTTETRHLNRLGQISQFDVCVCGYRARGHCRGMVSAENRAATAIACTHSAVTLLPPLLPRAC